MSFAIAAIYKRCEVYIAADTQMTGMLSGKIQNGVSKITKISESTSISSCGNVDFCSKCLESLKEKRAKASCAIPTASGVAKDLLSFAEEIEPIWSKEHFDIAPEAVFFVAGYDLFVPSISTIIVENHKLQLHTNGWVSGDYQFVLAPPSNMNFDQCIGMCKQHLLQYGIAGTSPEATLEALVKKIADLSDLVNDKVEVWKVHRTIGIH